MKKVVVTITLSTALVVGYLILDRGQIDDEQGGTSTKEQLMLESYETLLQLALNHQNVLNDIGSVSVDEGLPIIVADDAAYWRDTLFRIEVNGRNVIFVSKEQADSAAYSSYFWVTEYVYVDSTARIMIENPVQRLTYGFSYKKSNDSWTIRSVYRDSL